jgi:hypothetical protein
MIDSKLIISYNKIVLSSLNNKLNTEEKMEIQSFGIVCIVVIVLGTLIIAGMEYITIKNYKKTKPFIYPECFQAYHRPPTEQPAIQNFTPFSAMKVGDGPDLDAYLGIEKLY